MTATYSPQESVTILLGDVDAQVQDGSTVLDGIKHAAQKYGVEQHKVEALYIKRGQEAQID